LVYCKACSDRLKEFANLNLQNIRTIKDALNFKLKVGNIIYSFGEIINPGWVAIPENQLPLKLPSVKFYEPTGTGESPLAGISKWVNTKCPRCNAPARRETNTMPQWAGSCWYYIAYAINKNSKFEIRNSKLLKYWLPVDLYVGGVEHAVLHLLYARFWHKFLYDIGIVPTKEPFQKLFNQGLILGPDGEKMSKSRGNVINPDDMIKQYGADSLRLYEMFMGPLEQVKPWDPQGIVGMHRFLNRVWNLVIEWLKPKSQKFKITPTASRSATNDIKRLMHKTIKKVTDDILSLRFNTAISALMEFQNALAFRAHLLPKKDLQIAIKTLLSLLAPFAPHITEELWVYICGKSQSINSIHEMPWPKYNPKYLREEMVNYIIQINGKLRDTIKVKAGTSEKEVIDLAIKSSKISKWLEGKKIKKHIFVKDKLLNFVV
jgi:leucyl-tRNA synthetase